MFPTWSGVWCCLPSPLRSICDTIAIHIDFSCFAVHVADFEAVWVSEYGSTVTEYHDWFVAQYFTGVTDCGTEDMPIPAYGLNTAIWTEFLAFFVSGEHACVVPCPYETGIFTLPG